MIKEKLRKAYEEILQEIYLNATPSANISEIRKSREGFMRNWFMAYYLSNEKQNEIIDKISQEMKLSKWEKNQIVMSLALGYSPTNSKEVFERERKDYNKRLKEHFEKLKEFKEPTLCNCQNLCEKDKGYCSKCKEIANY